MEALLSKGVNFNTLTNGENPKIAASLLNLEKVVEENIRFNIPIYQRLYVWKINQIKTLLEDLKTAFDNDSTESYFLGGIMLSSSRNGKIDLVDGQQRFTSLWLICDALSNSNPELKRFTYFNNEPRIHFSIRHKAQEYLKDHNSFKKYFDEKDEVVEGLKSEITEIIPLATGRKIIIEVLNSFQKDSDFDSRLFGDYIFSKVQFSQTFIPAKSDMNRVFEAMNNRGKQLQHHELLKSKLLEKISSEHRLIYSIMWDACSDMNTYIEKSLKDVADLDWKNIFSNFDALRESERDTLIDNKYKLDALDIFKLLGKSNDNNEKEKSLFKILNEPLNNDSNNSKTNIKEDDYFSKQIRSIISFPTFLLHTLRIYLANTKGAEINSPDVNDKKLIENFDIETNFTDQKQVTEFIELLWKLRILFDRYVIKWIYNEEEKEEYHDIENIQISKSSITNKNGSTNETISIQRLSSTGETITALVVLQGMLYHSQEMITQYWLTPFLHFLSNAEIENDNEVLNRLEVLDNDLFYSTDSDKLKDRTYRFIFKDTSKLYNNLKNTTDYLSGAYGTNYPNYIFYKLEYILWKNREKLCKKYPKLNIDKWSNYRMTAKNSVEHIFPQKAQDENKHIQYLSEDRFEYIKNIKPLDEFGNLVLISPGMNSEYSNKPYKEKKGKFDSKLDIDSLKSALIFKEEEWDYDKAVFHRNEMISLIKEYINLTLNQ